jgi:hypothetical protein
VKWQVQRNTQHASINTWAAVWKFFLLILFVLILSEGAVWGLLNHADNDVLALCEAQVSLSACSRSNYVRVE